MVKRGLSNRRIFLLSAIKASAMVCLIGRLYYLQIGNSSKFKSLSNNNRIRVSLVNPKRGNIFDNSGSVLAYNQEQYDVVFEPINGVNVNEIIRKLLSLFNLSQLKQKNLYDLISTATAGIIILEDIDWDMIRTIESNRYNLHGVFVITNYHRFYPLHNIASHIIGYARKNYKNSLYYYVGQTGIEYSFNEELEGTPGIVQEEVNAKMHVVRSLSNISDKPGKDVHLSINVNLQKFIASQLNHKGGIVVMDVNNGEILATGSYPSYNNNDFVRSMTQTQWNNLKNDKEAPMLNRAVGLRIPPGSTFKIISALAALEDGTINAKTKFFCSGKIRIGNTTFRCWKSHGHGMISLNEAISSSCNVYFYHIGQRLNIDHLCTVADKLGVGSKFGIRLREGLAGVLPTNDWRKQRNIRWYTGDTVNSVIGHGYVLSTPLELATMTARVATGKNVMPVIEKIEKSVDFTSIVINTKNLEAVRRGMYDAVNSRKGTANKVYSNLQPIAGKTGTSQTANIMNSERQNHSLFVGYAPYYNPKYSVAVVMEHSESGSASKMAKKIFDYMYANYNF